MTDTARDALIGICFLYVINGVVVIFRLLGRVRGIGIGVDDVLAVAAFVCISKLTNLFLTEADWIESSFPAPVLASMLRCSSRGLAMTLTQNPSSFQNVRYPLPIHVHPRHGV